MIIVTVLPLYNWASADSEDATAASTTAPATTSSLRVILRVIGFSLAASAPFPRALFLRGRLRALIGQQRPELERLEGRLVGFLVEELPQAGIVGILLVGDLGLLSLLPEVVIALGDV